MKTAAVTAASRAADELASVPKISSAGHEFHPFGTDVYTLTAGRLEHLELVTAAVLESNTAILAAVADLTNIVADLQALIPPDAAAQLAAVLSNPALRFLGGARRK